MLSTSLRYQGETVTHRLLNLLRKSVLVSVFASCLLTTARAQLTEPSAQAVRDTVQAQLAAFAADDADLAFSYAAPVIRDMFQTPEKFMAMVQQTYPVVYRPAKVLFLAAKGPDSAVVQPVRMWDLGGNSWLATYRLERQTDGRWLINGCVLARERLNVEITLAY